MPQVAVLELRRDQHQVVIDDHVVERDELPAFASRHGLQHQGLRIVRPLQQYTASGRMPLTTHLELLASAYATLRQLQSESGARAYTLTQPTGPSWCLRNDDGPEFSVGLAVQNWESLLDTLSRVRADGGSDIVEVDLPVHLISAIIDELDSASPQLREAFGTSPNRRATQATPTGAPLPEDAADSARRRAELKSSWWTAAQVAQLLGSRAASNPSQYAANLRRQGRLLGVWHAPDRAYYHPPCQFAGGQLISQVAALLELLPGPSGSGWEQAEWLYSPHALLEARTPADVLPEDPDRVVEAAREEYQDGPDASW